MKYGNWMKREPREEVIETDKKGNKIRVLKRNENANKGGKGNGKPTR